MTTKAEKLLVSEEAIKTSRPFIDVFQQNRRAIFPCDTLSQREQGLEQGILAAELNLDVATTHFGSTASIVSNPKAGSYPFSNFLSDKFKIAIHGFASGTLHHDMDGTGTIVVCKILIVWS
jgi:hypothetical protein